jgi:hypothetical protein
MVAFMRIGEVKEEGWSWRPLSGGERPRVPSPTVPG